MLRNAQRWFGAPSPLEPYSSDFKPALDFRLYFCNYRNMTPQPNEQVAKYADMFSAMGAEARLRIMQLLLSAHPDGMVVGEIQQELNIPNSTLSHHLEKLKAEDLVRVRRASTFLHYTANTEALQESCGSFTPNAAPATRRWSRNPSFKSADRRPNEHHDIKEVVKEKYGQAALRVSTAGNSCCGDTPVCCGDPITSDLYDPIPVRMALPQEALLASLGCGNPTALARLNAGEVVLDLGSGGGIDVLLSARRVGPTGRAYGLDMTDEMLALANENKRKAGVENVEFLKGEIEHIPLPDNSVDVIISNCVINLSADKDRVLREAFRVLKPGGRLAVSDVVTRGEVPFEIRQSVLLWVGCIAGALEEHEYREKLGSAGFEEIER